MDTFLKEYFQQINHTDLLNNLNDNQLEKISLVVSYLLRQQENVISGLYQIKTNIETTKKERKQCMARIHNGNQCSRKCKNGQKFDYCGSHVHLLPYGRIDEEPIQKNRLVEKKTRGRKAKNKSNIDLNMVDLSKYIQTKVIIVSSTNMEYLIDDNGILFENDNNNTIVGRKLGENKYEWF